MLRTQNTNVLENSPNIVYAKKTTHKCVERRDEYDKIRKRSCDKPADNVKILDDFHRNNACHVKTCIPQKKIMAKVGLHDANGNFLTNEMITANVDANLRVGSNQIGYVYQEKRINDPDVLAQRLRENNPVAAGVAQKIAESNAQLFGAPHAWDGSDLGHSCVKCPERPKPCPVNICKKADPLNNPDIGLGSDGMAAKRNLREDSEAGAFRFRQAAMAKTVGEMGVGESLRGKTLEVGQDTGRKKDPEKARAKERAKEPMEPLRRSERIAAQTRGVVQGKLTRSERERSK